VKEEIDRVYQKYKKPARDYLDEIAKTEGSSTDQVADRIRASNLIKLRIGNKQVALRRGLGALRDEAMQISMEARKSGNSCLEEIKLYGTGRLRKGGQQLTPNEFFIAALARLSKRLDGYVQEAAHIEQQLQAAQNLATGRGQMQDGGMYGQYQKIGAKEILQLIKSQHEAFLTVTARIAECHRDADMLRNAFKRMYPDYANVFDDEDKREKADERIAAARAREQLLLNSAASSSSDSQTALPAAQGAPQAGAQQQQQAAPQTGFGFMPSAPISTAFGTTQAPTSSFGISSLGAAPNLSGFGSTTTATAAPTGTTPAFGAFGSTAPATTSFSLSNNIGGGFGSPQNKVGLSSPGAAAFGSTPSFGGFGSPAPTTGFGAPQTGGFGAPQTGGFGTGGFGSSSGFGSSAGDLAGVNTPRLTSSRPKAKKK
jgi:hypothetical protein